MSTLRQWSAKAHVQRTATVYYPQHHPILPEQRKEATLRRVWGGKRVLFTQAERRVSPDIICGITGAMQHNLRRRKALWVLMHTCKLSSLYERYFEYADLLG